MEPVEALAAITEEWDKRDWDEAFAECVYTILERYHGRDAKPLPPRDYTWFWEARGMDGPPDMSGKE